MTSRHAFTLVALLAPGALAATSACGRAGNTGTGGAKDSSTKATSGGPMAASAGRTSSSGTATSATATGSSSGAGGASANPVWQALANAPIGCTVNRMVNAAQVRAFSWQPCPGIAGCEESVPEAGLAGLTLDHGIVEEEPNETRVIFDADDGTNFDVYFATEDGWLLDAYQVSMAVPPNCLLYAGAAWGSRYGVLLSAGQGGPGQNGGLLHTFGDPSDPLPFTVGQALGYGPSEGSVPMGATRWVWDVTGTALVSVSTADGGDFAVPSAAFLPDASPPVLEIDNVTTNGTTFLFDQILGTPDGGVTGILATSDGKSLASPYLVPSDGSFYVDPVYAGSYVAWFRGIGYTGEPNSYQAMEVWASPYSADPTGLVPFKVDDYPANGIVAAYGAAGRVAAGVGGSVSDPSTWKMAVWNMATKQRTVYAGPSGLTQVDALGITSKYLWVTFGPGNNTISTYVRYTLN